MRAGDPHLAHAKTAEQLREAIVGAVDVQSTATGGVRPSRVPRDLRPQIPTEFMRLTLEAPAGVRLRWRTRATRIDLRLAIQRFHFAGSPLSFHPSVDLIDDGLVLSRKVPGGVAELDMAVDAVSVSDGEVVTVTFDQLSGSDRVVELWLPQNATVELFGAESDAELHPTDTSAPTWVHYGSSISHGMELERPTEMWPAVAARALGWDLTTLGLAGNAMLDPFVARTIARTRADVISLKVGINLVNFDAMTLRTFRPALHGFLDTIREAHPSARIILVSPIAAPDIEDRHGPTGPDPDRLPALRIGGAAGASPHGDDALTLKRLRSAMAEVVARRQESDSLLEYLDGTLLLSAADDAAGMLPDGLHPDARGHEAMGRRFASWVGRAR